ncbi:MAG: 30S ribosomal protein S4e [Candidatus Micrarchaeota archaeon]
MGKRGGTTHLKRLATPKAVPISDKKANEWIIRQEPGPHPRERSIALGVLLRDVLKLVKTAREVKTVLTGRLVLVDGKVRTSEKFPVGFMDVVSLPKMKKHYRLVVDWKARLVPVEVDDKGSATKLLQISRKHTVKGGKLNITLHDGKNMLADNNLHVGDTISVSLPDAKIQSHLKLENGARCLIVEGKHAGNLVTLKGIIPRAGGKPNEAKVEGKDAEFITVAKYLFVVGGDFEVGTHG